MAHHIVRSSGTRTAAGARTRALRLAAPAVLCMLALPVVSGCGGSGAQATPGVASLPTSQAPSQAAGTSGTAGAPAQTPASPSAGSSGSSGSDDGDTSQAPQMRLDDTPERREALIHAWDQCLVDHGAHWTTTRPGVAGAPAQVADPIPPAASAACKSKLPLMPRELNPALNPHYRDDMLANIKCLRAHGVMVHLTSDTSVNANGLSWTFDSGNAPLPPNESQIEDQCQLEAFGNGKGQ